MASGFDSFIQSPAPFEGGERGPEDFPGAVQAIVLTVAFGALMVAIGLLQSAIWGSDFAAAEVLGTNTLAAAIVLGWGWHRTGLSSRVIFRFERVSPQLFLPMLVLLLGTSIVFSEIDNAMRWLWPVPADLKEMFQLMLSGGAVSFLLVVVEAPLTEELFFRGLILRGLIAHYGVRRAVVLQAFLFAALHMNPWQFIPAFFIGLFLGWLFVKTRSLGACVLCHAAWNGLAFFVAGYAESLGLVVPGYTGISVEPVVFQPASLLAVGVGLGAVGWLWLRQVCQRAVTPVS